MSAILLLMERRDIVIGIVILVVLALAIFLLRRNPTVPQSSFSPAPTTSIESQLEDALRVDVPDDVEKAELKSVSGVTATALATRKWANNRFEATVLADLPNLESGFYQAWIVKDNTFISLGRMRIAKGGWIVEFQSNTNYSDYNNVIVTQETTADNQPEKRVVEGSF